MPPFAPMISSKIARAPWRDLPPAIWAMGLGSLFMDASSELIHSLLPVFMVSVLGTSVVTVGFVEGVAEATAAIVKVFSGALSDHLGKRKSLMIAGYALAALTKPIFPLADSVGWVFGARFVDRVGKGIRGAPRDALVADLTAVEVRGAAYGLRQALDSVGAMIGPSLAILLMIAFAQDIRTVLWFAALPAFIAVALLVIFVREPEQHAARAARKAIAWSDVKLLPSSYWRIVGLGAAFTLARFSEAFLVLRAQEVGLPIAYVPVVMIVMNVFYSAGAYPAGAAADRMRARTLLIVGLALLVAADLVLAFGTSVALVLVGAALWGLHMATTQGLLSKLVADAAPAALIGTAFGFFNLVSGVALLLASAIAGALWTSHGASATFVAGACFAALAALGVFLAQLHVSAD
jgi:MFS family permease